MKSLRDVLDDFTEYLIHDQSLSENTATQYAYEIGRFIDRVAWKKMDALPVLNGGVIAFGAPNFLSKIDALFLKQIDIIDIMEWRRYMDERKHVPATIVRKFSALKKFFDFLDIEDMSLENLRNETEKRFRMPRVTPPQIMPLTAEVAETVLDKPDLRKSMGRRDYAILMLLFVESLRVSEVRNLDIEDIGEKYGNRVLSVKGKGRGGQKEEVRLREDVYDALRDCIRKRNQGNQAIFQASDTGNRLSVRAIQKLVAKYGKEAGVKLRPQLTRITSITTTALQGIKDGMGEAALVKDIQLHARHRNPSTTFRYIKDAREASESSAVMHCPIKSGRR